MCMLFSKGLVPRLQVSSFGVIPKMNQPNKWRLILDLPHPTGVSINDGISKSLSTLSYITIDTVTDKICQLGQGSLLAKNGCPTCIPTSPSTSRLLGYEVERTALHQHCSPLWTAFSSQNLHCISQRPPIDYLQARSNLGGTLSG